MTYPQHTKVCGVVAKSQSSNLALTKQNEGLCNRTEIIR